MDNDDDRASKSSDPESVFEEVDRGLEAWAGGGEDRDVDDLKRRNSIMETLLNVSTAINSTLNLDDLLRKIVGAIIRITDTNRGCLMLIGEEGELIPMIGLSAGGDEIPLGKFDVSLSAIQRAAVGGEASVVDDAQVEEDLKDQKSIIDLDIRTVICIPLRFADKPVGIIYGDSDRISGIFATADLPILEAFGAQAAVAIDNARRHGELESIKSSLENQNVILRQELADKYEFSGIVGRSKPMREIFDVIRKVAPLGTTVLIQGETGTGKELIAKAIHYNSRRQNKPIVSVNCGALPKDILESELFGYKRGAFTGADQDRGGLFEAANGGTLFLDEIGEMPVELQVKLLRALQEGEIRRLGEDSSRAVDVRVIAATNKDLAAEIENGTFRSDLYYRLNVVPIYLPPLRERQEDILPLADYFLEKVANQMGKQKLLLARGAKELLLNHPWYGNVRELENVIERALALSEGKKTIDVTNFEHLIRKRSPDQMDAEEVSLKSMLLVWEKELLRKMLIRNSWNVSRTACTLKISRQQLHNKIKKFNLNPEI